MNTRPTISPVIWYSDPRAAIAWLEKAFGFETRMVVDDGTGGVIHSELWIDDGCIMVAGPPRGTAVSPNQFSGRHTQSTHVQLLGRIDEHCEVARTAGARIEREPKTMPYGDRTYACLDIEDHPWSFGQTVNSMTPQEIAAATGAVITGSK